MIGKVMGNMENKVFSKFSVIKTKKYKIRKKIRKNTKLA